MRTSRTDEFAWVKWLFIAAGTVAVIMGLIEWNARRQAAASVKEWMRPMTVDEKAQLEAAMAEQLAELDRELAKTPPQQIRQLQLRVGSPPASTSKERAPLAPDERCMSGQRFQRVENGWVQVGSC